jgi:hypothetical protein
MGESNGDEDGSGVNGDGSGGNSLSWQGAGTETSISQNWSSMAAALRNFSWMDANRFRVFSSERIYRRKGDVRGWTRGPHHLVAQPGGSHATTWCGCLLSLLRLCFGLRLRDSKIGTSGFVSSNSENISCVTFLKHQNSRKQELTLWHLVNRLVLESA